MRVVTEVARVMANNVKTFLSNHHIVMSGDGLIRQREKRKMLWNEVGLDREPVIRHDLGAEVAHKRECFCSRIVGQCVILNQSYPLDLHAMHHSFLAQAFIPIQQRSLSEVVRND